MGTILFNASGQQILLTKELGRGGEGSIFEVSHDSGLAAKVYHRAGDGEKLRQMAKLKNAELLRVAAWPIDTLHESSGVVRGFLMPKVVGHREIHQLYSPAQRRVHFPTCNWSSLVHVAMNCGAAAETVHESGHVIGDVNERGFMVSPQGTVRVIDCDSFQIRNGVKTFRCVVGVPHYTPPELQPADFHLVDRTPNHDCFGLAVLIFHLLFMGRHPFAGVYSGSGDMPIERAISEGRFAFARSASSLQMSPPPNSINIGCVSPEVAEMFELAFKKGAASRPSARDWRLALASLKASLVRCDRDVAHWYSRAARQCPWCAIEAHGGPSFFSSAADAFDFDTGFDLLEAWRRIESVLATPAPPGVKLPSPPQGIKGAATAPNADLRSGGDLLPTPTPPKLRLLERPDLPRYAPELREERPPAWFADEMEPIIPELVERPSDEQPPASLSEAEPNIPEFVPFLGAEPPPEDEPEPSLPPFVPDTVEQDPKYDPIPEPTLPEWRAFDPTVPARRRYRNARGSGDYRLAKWGAISAGTMLPLGYLSWPIAAVFGLFLIAFAANWIILWIPLFRRYRQELAVVGGRESLVRERYDATVKRIQVERIAIRAQNERSRRIWAEQVANLGRLRKELPESNARKHVIWERECEQIRSVQEQVRSENQRRHADWQARMEEHERRRRAEWEAECTTLRSLQVEIRLKNERRRAEWRAEREEDERRRRADWEVKCGRVRSLQEEIRLRNRERRAQWRARVQEHEQRRRAEWALEVERVEARRAEIASANEEARRHWQADMDRCEAERAEIERHNAGVAATRARWKAERDRRERRLRECENDVRTRLAEWTRRFPFRDGWSETIRQLTEATAEYERLKADFENRRDELCGDARQIQLEGFLRGVLIEDADLPGIKEARKDKLRLHGIETAFDVSYETLRPVLGRGFGPKLLKILLDWRASIERSFHFDPQKVVLPPALRALHARYRGRRLSLQQRLRDGPEHLHQILRDSDQQREEFQHSCFEVVIRLAQARADLEIMRE